MNVPNVASLVIFIHWVQHLTFQWLQKHPLENARNMVSGNITLNNILASLSTVETTVLWHSFYESKGILYTIYTETDTNMFQITRGFTFKFTSIHWLFYISHTASTSDMSWQLEIDAIYQTIVEIPAYLHTHIHVFVMTSWEQINIHIVEQFSCLQHA